MVRESGISATKPIFPSYLLPSLRLPFVHRRESSASSTATSLSRLSEEDDSDISSAYTSPSNSPPKHDGTIVDGESRGNRLSRTEADTLRCGSCSADLAFTFQTVSKGFTGRHGRALLVTPMNGQDSLLNIRTGRNENRQLVTGWHVVADISCGTCSTKLGWKYVDAKEPSQKYKVGKFILEMERVVTYRSWEYEDDHRSQTDSKAQGSVSIKSGPSAGRAQNEASDDEILFDSEDEDECEDIFAGTWNAETVAKRRRSMGTRKSTVN